MRTEVDIHPSVVAGWAQQAVGASERLAAVPAVLSEARDLAHAGGTGLAGAAALAALVDAAGRATDAGRRRAHGTGAKLSTSAATYADTDSALAREITPVVPGDASWL